MYSRIDENNKKFKRNLYIPSGVSVELVDGYYCFLGPKGKIKHRLHEFLLVNISDNELTIFLKNIRFRKRELLKIYPLINTTCALFHNYIFGVLNLFSKYLVLKGIGYKAEYDSKACMLKLSLGFSHIVNIDIPKDIVIELSDNINIVIKGVSKCKVGQFALDIRKRRIPDIYKGNGIMYKNEIIKLKSPKKSK